MTTRRSLLLATLATILLGNLPVLAGDASQQWVRSGALPAPEAVQAAAADEKFLYAIASKQVAQYDRETGQRVAVSQGTAKHLNSGFLWKGRLYCAHSNYPRKPEQSEIKVLDLASMELAPFKHFDNTNGSLTWAVRHADHWWCNFAHYKEDNSRTVLIKFDDAWKELGRWSYPPEVLRELGDYSVSGGVWRDNCLLVTGHDHAVVYRLRLPEDSGALTFVDKLPVPFTGQGIALDPLTGGLVGIRRAKAQIVLASLRSTRPLQLRVLSYNIHHGEGVDGKLDLARIASVIRSTQADIVALQEVDCQVERTGNVDQAAELGRRLQMEAVFGGNIRLGTGDYGNSVLSRFPIRTHKNHKLPRFDDGEQRGVLEIKIDLPDNQPPLLLLATHLDHRKEERERIASAKLINEFVADSRHRPALLLGDLNAIPDSRTMAEFAKAWTRTNQEILPTIPVVVPKHQIDYVLLRPENRWKVVETKVIDEQVASDHRPILAVLELLPAD